MRIIAGEWRGRRLASVGAGDAGAALRPTGDRVRESVFNVLAGAMGDPVPGAQVLDLFAGTGALGLEALSRGAAEAVFVENGAAALKLLDENITLFRAGARARVLRRDARALGPVREGPVPATLVFLDPPYGRGLGEEALEAALKGGWIAQGALIVWEEGAPIRPPAGLRLRDARRYGAATLSILEKI
ncbi:16S rRNA (guanine(966)-N(2))-methyltransferase RsmD [Roseovarius sp. LXJ103]|uniref:16S rRNA (guanine(966)-N(2))-methyltransferase RsmD n=1 Tax=Roseovarius carneus TaxID=2853164 RepID=UPI000D622AF1|nr:16S rRNA (guanine(966)-N(2))-methyltransferase RsmD [Roseovarius carneus]MBZ8118429.1 16S rRNA (guanine(966)-N(2))-methyltransferase RsmD [Roseovarius carneus]PWE35866.1 16S rRNA (guanine(966)-N(2))-methyltransferase RsmD [Pelagicola sp. LXJ1103]